MTAKYNLSPTEKLNYVQKGKSKGQFKKAFKQVLLFFALIGLFVLMFVPFLRNYKKNKIMDAEIAEAKANINQYEKTNEELKTITSYLSTNQAVEEKARLNLGLQKAGEKVGVYPITADRWIDMGQIDELNHAKELLSSDII